MQQFGLILKLVVGIILGLIVGAYSGEWAGTKWLMYVVVFGRSLLKDIIQFFYPNLLELFFPIILSC